RSISGSTRFTTRSKSSSRARVGAGSAGWETFVRSGVAEAERDRLTRGRSRDRAYVPRRALEDRHHQRAPARPRRRRPPRPRSSAEARTHPSTGAARDRAVRRLHPGNARALPEALLDAPLGHAAGARLLGERSYPPTLREGGPTAPRARGVSATRSAHRRGG